MKKLLTIFIALWLFIGLNTSLIYAQCTNYSNYGTISPTGAWNSMTMYSGSAGLATFWGNANVNYTFGVCSNEDTYVRIYDSNWNLVAQNDNGGWCNWWDPQLTYTPSVSGYFRVLFTQNSCGALSQNLSFDYRAVDNDVYCVPTRTNNFMYISNVKLKDINKQSPNVGYERYTDVFTSLVGGGTYNLSMNVSYGYDYRILAWIDFNNDGDFGDAGEQVANKYFGGEIFDPKLDLIIPRNAATGNHRLRIRYSYAWNGTTSSCGNSYYGEVEDYSVTILPTPLISDFTPGLLNSTCLSGSKPFEINLLNSTGVDQSNFEVYAKITSPSGAVVNRTYPYANVLLAGNAEVIKDNLAFTEVGIYKIELWDNVVGNSLFFELRNNDSFTHPYYMDDEPNFTQSTYWMHGSQFGRGNNFIAGNINGNDSIYSPVFSIQKTAQFFQYYINSDNLSVGDTVYVQIRQDCNTLFSTFDKVVVGTPGNYNRYLNTNQGFDLSSYNGKKVQFRFYVVSKSGNFPYVALDYVNIFPGYDFIVEDIIFDKRPFNTNDKYRIGVVVKNNGARTQKDIVVDLSVYGNLPQNLSATLTEPIQYNNTDTAYFDVNATLSGIYEFIAIANAPIDDNGSNNSYSRDIQLDDVQILPVRLTGNFSNNDDPADVNERDNVTFYFDNMFSNGNSLETNYIARDDDASATSFVFGPVTTNSYITFEYSVWGYDDGFNFSNKFGSEDIIRLQVSEDYGRTFTTLTYVDASSYNQQLTWQAFPVGNLTSKAGKKLIFRILVQNGVGADVTNGLMVEVRNLYIGGSELSVVSIDSNVDPACGNPTANFSVRVNNNTPVPAINSKVRLEVTGEVFSDTASVQTIGNLAPYESRLINFGTYNISQSDAYQLNANVTNSLDYKFDNNDFNTSFTVIPAKNTPYVEKFEWSFNAGEYAYSNTNHSGWDISTQALSGGEVASFTTMKIGQIQTGDFLVFEYLSQAYDNSMNRLGTYLRTGDVASVYVSTDCGINWTKVKDITAHANTNDPNAYPFESTGNISLSAYVGKEIRVKVEFVKGNPEGLAIFSVDNFQVIGSGDARVSYIHFDQYVNGVAVCGSASDHVMVEIENMGINSLTNIPVVLKRVYNQDTTTVFATYNGTILPDETGMLDVAGFNTLEFGDYEIIAATVLPGDLDSNNDENSTTLTVQALSTVPYYYDGSWSSGNWQYYTETNFWSVNVDLTNNGVFDSYLATPYMTDGDTSFVTIQKLGPIRSDYVLRIKYNVFTFDDDQTPLGNYFRDGDKFEVQISSNCGASYSTIYTADLSNHVNSPDDAILALNLDAFNGKEIAVRLNIVKGSDIGKIRFGLNDLQVTIPAADLQMNQVFVEKEVCGKANQAVYAVITNNSTYETLTGFTVSAQVIVNNVIEASFSTVYNTNLLPGVTDTVIVGTFDSQMPNDYEVEAWLELDEDVNGNNNDANFNFTIYPPVAIPYYNNFNQNPANWLMKENAYWDGWNRIWTNAIVPGEVSVYYSPVFENLTSSSQLEYDFQKSGEFAIGDMLNVSVSDNCGATWTLVNSVKNDDNLASFVVDRQFVSLAAFAGKDIIVKFEFSNQNGNAYQVAIDNFAITHTDIAVLGIVNETHKFDINLFNPNSGTFNFAERYITCGTPNDSLLVVIENKGSTTVNSVAIKIDITGKTTATLTKNFTTPLQPGAKGWIYVGSVNSQTPGLLDMRASILVAQDGNAANDTIGFSVTTQETYNMPFTAFNSGKFNEPYYWKYDVNGRMSRYYSSVRTANYLTKDQSAYAISPKVHAEANTWLYFNYSVYNSLGEGHIIHDEAMSVYVVSNCSGTKTEVWRMDVNSTDNTSNGTIALDLSAYAGSDIQIVFMAEKGNSDGSFYADFSNINILGNEPVTAVIESGDDKFSSTNGAEICEGAWYSLYLENPVLASMTYKWSFAGADTSYVISENSYFNGNVEKYNTGTITLEAWYTTNPGNVFTATIDMKVSPLPTKPEISGDMEVASNVGTSIYTLTGMHADEYVWYISNGGQISGDAMGTVYWNSGYLGTSIINAFGVNECGSGDEGELLVRVVYLNPTPGSNVTEVKEGEVNTIVAPSNTDISTYPNPSNGQFALSLPEGVTEGKLIIKNNLGYVVDQEIVISNKHDVSLRDLTPGVYHITFIAKDKVYTQSIVIE